eukprot:TRINITY_DN97_c0_g1_i11.p1 TRINITY_DN97_c0_g1~~TRINITY_DN97_c0_g1_i11.p1  ORF type:complete len:80 (-),score=15.24 TRINITY_DN97_c0_g1_i11:265-483(-)
MDACASLGTGWSLCTREETASALCLGKGCWHDCAHVWVLDPQVDESSSSQQPESSSRRTLKDRLLLQTQVEA